MGNALLLSGEVIRSYVALLDSIQTHILAEFFSLCSFVC